MAHCRRLADRIRPVCRNARCWAAARCRAGDRGEYLTDRRALLERLLSEGTAKAAADTLDDVSNRGACINVATTISCSLRRAVAAVRETNSPGTGRTLPQKAWSYSPLPAVSHPIPTPGH
jgi:hypothetical protein